jgi:hypothetical protein
MFYLLHSSAIALLMLGSYGLGYKQATKKERENGCSVTLVRGNV